MPTRVNMRPLPILLGALTLVSTTSWVLDASGQPDAPADSAPEPVEPVAISIDGTDALHTEIVSAILRELGTTLDPTSVRRVAVTVSADKVVVRFTDAKGVIVGRELERPADDEDLVELVALMAGNLARDQAGALLAELEGSPSTDSEPPTQDAPAADETKVAKTIVEPPPKKRPPPLPSPDEPADVAKPPPWKPKFTVAQAAFVSPLGVFWDSEERTFALDFSMLFGRSGGLSGVGIHGVGSHLHGDHRGMSISGVWAYRGGSLSGASIAGVFHASTSPHVRGLEIAGVANLDVFGEAPSAVSGAQIAGVVNASGDAAGLQIGGVVNVSDDLHGVQVGGATNVAHNGGGLQIGGVTNHAGDFAGVQVAGAVNTARDVKGVQLGLVNIARKVKGAQVGLINIAEENEGTAIGLVNAAGNGDVQVATWVGVTSLTNIGVKMRVGPMFIQPGFGFHPIDGRSLSGQFAIGAHIPVDPVFLEVVTGYAYEQPLENADGTSSIDVDGHHALRLLGQVGIQLNEYIGLFGGGGVHVDVTQSSLDDSADVRPEVVGGILLF